MRKILFFLLLSCGVNAQQFNQVTVSKNTRQLDTITTVGVTAGMVLTYTSSGSIPTWQPAAGGGTNYLADTIGGLGSKPVLITQHYLNTILGSYLTVADSSFMASKNWVESYISNLHYVSQSDSNTRTGFATIYYVLTHAGTGGVDTGTYQSAISWYQALKQISDTANTLQRTKDSNTKHGASTIYYVKSQISDSVAHYVQKMDSNSAGYSYTTVYYTKELISDSANTLLRIKDTNTKTGAATIYYAKSQIQDSANNLQRTKDSNTQKHFVSLNYFNTHSILVGGQSPAGALQYGTTNSQVNQWLWNGSIVGQFDYTEFNWGYLSTAMNSSISMGEFSAATGSNCVSLGTTAQATGDHCVALGASASTGATINSTAIGYLSTVLLNNAVQLGNSSVTYFGFGTGSMTTTTLAPNVYYDYHTGQFLRSTDTVPITYVSDSGIASGFGWKVSATLPRVGKIDTTVITSKTYLTSKLAPYILFADTAITVSTITTWTKKVSSIFGLHDSLLGYSQRKDSNVKAGYSTIYFVKSQINDTANTLLRTKDTNTKTGAATIYYVKSQIHDSTQNYQQIKDSNTKAGYSTIYYVNNKLVAYVPFADTASGTSWTKKISSLYGLHDSLLGYAQIKDTNNRKSISSTYNVLNQLSLFTGTNNIVRTGTLIGGATRAVHIKLYTFYHIGDVRAYEWGNGAGVHWEQE